MPETRWGREGEGVCRWRVVWHVWINGGCQADNAKLAWAGYNHIYQFNSCIMNGIGKHMEFTHVAMHFTWNCGNSLKVKQEKNILIFQTDISDEQPHEYFRRRLSAEGAKPESNNR